MDQITQNQKSETIQQRAYAAFCEAAARINIDRSSLLLQFSDILYEKYGMDVLLKDGSFDDLTDEQARKVLEALPDLADARDLSAEIQASLGL